MDDAIAGIVSVFGFLIVLGIVIGLAYVLPITWGIKIAKRKGYSRAWMFLGIYPVLGWITLIVLALLPARTLCVSCGGFVGACFKLCPYCHNEVRPAHQGHPQDQSYWAPTEATVMEGWRDTPAGEKRDQSRQIATIDSGKPDSTVPCEELEQPLAAIDSDKSDSTVPCEEQGQLLAAIDSGKPGSTVPCREQEQPCTVNRTEDATQAYHTKVEWKATGIVLGTITAGILAAIWFSDPPHGPAIASTSSAVARPAAQQQTQWQSIRDAAREAGFQFGADITDDRQALNFLLQRANNPVSDEDRQFLEGYKTSQRLVADNEVLKGIKSMGVLVHLNTTDTRAETAFIEAVTPGIKSRLRQAGIHVVDSQAEADAVLTVYVGYAWARQGPMYAWTTELAVGEFTHVIRHGQHSLFPSRIWCGSNVVSTVASPSVNYTDCFPNAISPLFTKLLNDYRAANQP